MRGESTREGESTLLLFAIIEIRPPMRGHFQSLATIRRLRTRRPEVILKRGQTHNEQLKRHFIVHEKPEAELRRVLMKWVVVTGTKRNRQPQMHWWIN
jgi:hypothetical protein